jgi:hypothetical protein
VNHVTLDSCTPVKMGDYINHLEASNIREVEKKDILKKIKKLIDVKV